MRIKLSVNLKHSSPYAFKMRGMPKSQGRQRKNWTWQITHVIYVQNTMFLLLIFMLFASFFSRKKQFDWRIYC